MAEPDYDPVRYAQTEQVTDYIKRLSGQLLDGYFSAKAPDIDALIQQTGFERDGEFLLRSKDIYYDTDGISESQIEGVALCPECSGVLRLETWSSVTPLSLGVEVPVGACAKCQALGQQVLKEALSSDKYRYIQSINRSAKEYVRHGF